MRQHLIRLAAKHDRGDAMPTMRRHDNQIAFLPFRRIDICLIGLRILQINCLA